MFQWNREHFKNIFKGKKEIKVEIHSLNEFFIKEGVDLDKFNKEKDFFGKHGDALTREEIFQKQKSREIQLDEGDRNSKLFHNSTKQRRNVNRIVRIKDKRRNILEFPSTIAGESVNFCKKMLNNLEVSNLEEQKKLLVNIPKIATKEKKRMLNSKLTLAEFEMDLNQLDLDKALGLDGFPTGFLQKCWHFLGEE